MRPIQNAGGEETIRERSYPVAKATAITAGQVVQLSGGKVVPAAAAQTAAILGIAGEDHSGTADILNPRADGDEILVCDNPGLIFECPGADDQGRERQRRDARSGKRGCCAGAADDAYNAAVLVLKSKTAGSSNSDKPGTRRAVTDYAKSGTVLTLETGGTPAARGRV